MHDKEKLSMYVDITKITIIICWVSLIGFWLLKIFGGNLFEIMVENENFLKFSELVQNSWLKYVYTLINIFISNYLMFGAISQKFVFKPLELAYIILSIISMWVVVCFIKIDLLSAFYGYILIVIYSLKVQKGWKKSFGFMAIAFELSFSIISMLIRNVEISVTNNYMVAIVLSIDVYIMYVLYFLYSNLLRLRKE